MEKRKSKQLGKTDRGIKIFIGFLALIIRCRIYTALMDEMQDAASYTDF